MSKKKKKINKQIRLFIGNRKGGVSKTSLSIMFGEWFATQGYKVLLIDLDGQCNLSNRFLDMENRNGKFYPPVHPEYDPETDKDWSGYGSSEDIYRYGEMITYPTKVDNLEIIPANFDLSDIEAVDKREVASKIESVLKDNLDIPELKNEYEIIIFDTSPSNGPITKSAIRAATHTIIPFIPRKFGAEGLMGMFNLWTRENKSRPEGEELVLAGLLPTQTKKSKEMKDLLANIKESDFLGEHLAGVQMNQWEDYTRLADSPEFSPFKTLNEKNKTRKQAIEICQYFEDKILKGV